MACKGKFYMIGGNGIQPVNMFDPYTEEWTIRAEPPVEMHHFQAARYGENIYVMGAFTGQGPDERPLEHIYIYNTREDRWSKGDPLPGDRLRGSCGVVAYRGQFYMIGGTRDRLTGPHTAWVDRYDPTSGKWKKLADAPRNRYAFHAGICNGKIYAVGGKGTLWFNEISSESEIPNVDVFDIASRRWITLPAEKYLPTLRYGASTVVMLDHLLVIGGENDQNEGSMKVVEAFDTEEGAWERWGDLQEGRSNTQSFMCVGTVFIASGSTIEMLEMK
jgi:N-acetylneuraminic acid mutarotase